MRVKPLAWKLNSGSNITRGWWEAIIIDDDLKTSPPFMYRFENPGTPFDPIIIHYGTRGAHNPLIYGCKTVKEAKDACYKHHEQYILGKIEV